MSTLPETPFGMLPPANSSLRDDFQSILRSTLFAEPPPVEPAMVPLVVRRLILRIAREANVTFVSGAVDILCRNGDADGVTDMLARLASPFFNGTTAHRENIQRAFAKMINEALRDQTTGAQEEVSVRRARSPEAKQPSARDQNDISERLSSVLEELVRQQQQTASLLISRTIRLALIGFARRAYPRGRHRRRVAERCFSGDDRLPISDDLMNFYRATLQK